MWFLLFAMFEGDDREIVYAHVHDTACIMNTRRQLIFKR